jgi:hypothetical protein
MKQKAKSFKKSLELYKAGDRWAVERNTYYKVRLALTIKN